MNSLVELQRWLYFSAVDALQALPTAGVAALPVLIGTAFGFGMLHALLPGHGKSVLASYYAGDGHVWGAVGASAVLIATHVGSAILLVLSGFMILQRTITGAGRAPVLEHISQGLIVLVGLWLLWRAFRPSAHHHGRSGVALGFVTGLVPCPLTTFIMTFAVAKQLVVPGLILASAFATGMIATVAVFPLLAVLLRTQLLPLMMRTQVWRAWIGRGLEIGAAIAIVLLGLRPLVR
jgi:nickel/cobalt transporter (NicO) family protein